VLGVVYRFPLWGRTQSPNLRQNRSIPNPHQSSELTIMPTTAIHEGGKSPASLVAQTIVDNHVSLSPLETSKRKHKRALGHCSWLHLLADSVPRTIPPPSSHVRCHLCLPRWSHNAFHLPRIKRRSRILRQARYGGHALCRYQTTDKPACAALIQDCATHPSQVASSSAQHRTNRRAIAA
jgi:hypothetical protein